MVQILLTLLLLHDLLCFLLEHLLKKFRLNQLMFVLYRKLSLREFLLQLGTDHYFLQRRRDRDFPWLRVVEIQQIRQRINPGTTTNRSGSGFPYLLNTLKK